VTDHVNRTPVYLTSIELENVRCFGERQILDLTDGQGRPVRWMLLLGDNGVGKTTLLQCLAWMRPVPCAVEKERVTAIQPALTDEQNEVLNSLIRVGGKVEVTLEASHCIGRNLAPAGPDDADTAPSLLTRFVMQGENGRLPEDMSGEQEPTQIPGGVDLPADLAMFAYGATRRSGTLKLGKGDLADPLASLFEGSTELYDAEDILQKLDYRATKDGAERDATRLQRVKRILATVLPEVADEQAIHILGPEILGESGGVRFKTLDGWVRLSALSLGYRTMLTWVVDLALRLHERYPESPDPLSEPGIVLIDEIDLHLHPRWQRHAMEDLSECFPRLQFVATAHSPLIVQAAEGANLAVLRREGDRVTIDKRSQSVNEWRADQILASDLFDVPPRSRPVESWIEERDALLDRADRSPSEEERLGALEEKIARLPTQDPDDQAAMDLIRSVAEKLRDSGIGRS
jgi:energy-coupling factor transporter ATP-binding protein EcfA2